MTRVYYKEAVGAFVVFDVTRNATFEAAAKWKADIDSKVTIGVEEKNIPVVLLANKIDLTPDGISSFQSPSFMDQYCNEHNFVGWLFFFFVRMNFYVLFKGLKQVPKII